MKKINKYLFGAFAALLTAGLFSCVEEAPEYVPGAPEAAGCNAIYFPTQEASGDHTYDPTMEKKITVTVSRDSLKSASNPLPEITVPLKATVSEEGIFVVPETVSFADGQTEATVDITFPEAKTAVKYDLSLGIDGAAYASVYNSTTNFIELSVFCVEWRYFAVKDGKETYSLTEDGATLIHWTQRHWGETAWGYVKYYQVDDVRYCETVTIGHNYKGEDYFDPGFCGTGPEWTFKWHKDLKNNVGGDIIDLDVNFYYHNDNYDSDVYAYDWRHYWNDINGNYNDDIYEFVNGGGYNPNESYPLSYYDGNGGFIFYVSRYYIMGLGGWTPPSPDMDGIAEGFTRVDYSLAVSAYETEDGVAPVEFELGADVTAVKYVVAEGELSAKEAGKLVDAIVANEAENIQTLAVESTDTIIGVSPAASGIYTLVAVSYAGEDAKESDFVSFTYVAAADKEEYAAVVTVATEPTSAMYEHVGLTAINSFSYFVYGEGLTAVKVGVFKTADVESKGAETLAASIKNAVDEETLAAINGAGYADVATGLDALTSYTVVVWATNDYNSTVATAQYETDGLPNEPTGTVGTYTYAQFWEGDDPDLALLINPNYENTYAIGNWGGGIEMGFTWDKETNKCLVKDQYTGYTHSTYGEVWVDELGDYAGSFDGDFFQSYYDPETETFHFNVIYYVSAGYFGKGEETFKLGAAAGANGRRMMSLDVPATNVKAVGNHGKIHYNVERNPQTVAVKAVKVERPARPNRFSAPVKMDNQTLKF